MIKVTEAMKELEKLADYYGNDVEDWEIGKYIKQQEKKDELLELYKDLYNSLSGCDKDNIFIELTSKIKKLEEELA